MSGLCRARAPKTPLGRAGESRARSPTLAGRASRLIDSLRRALMMTATTTVMMIVMVMDLAG